MILFLHKTSLKCACIFFCILGALHVVGQNTNPLDTTIYYLHQLTGVEASDTITLRKLWEPENTISPSALADTRFLEAMQRLKRVLPQDKYYSLAFQFLSHACFASISGEYDYPINYGLQFVEELKSYATVKEKYIFLKGLRDLRVPFRNSSRIYEGIETYSKLSSYFYQRNDSSAVSIADNVLASFYNTLGLADKAIYTQLRSIDYLNNDLIPSDTTYLGYGDPPNIGLYGKMNRKMVLGSYYVNDENPKKALEQFYGVFSLIKKSNRHEYIPEPTFLYLQMIKAKLLLKTDSVDFYFSKILDNFDQTGIAPNELAHYYQARSYGYYVAEKMDSAEVNILKCIRVISDNQLPMTSIMGALTPAYYLALVRIKQNRTKEAIDQLISETSRLKSLNLRKETLREIKLLAEAYMVQGDFKNASETWVGYNDFLAEMIASEKNNRSISFDIEKRMAENEKAVQLLEAENQYNRKKQYFLIGILGLLILLAFGLLTRNRFKQRVNKELTRKNQEIESTLNKLQSTQNLLIQSEKMASLGELTAGIAHEIQNPLNFVNNFSEVNTELIDELQHELKTGNTAEAITISNHIKDNEEKINHHGKRADAIVKGMLQHSRSSSGVKEPTDINALADEYLRLAYHGLRAKDKSFNATIKTDFDQSIGLINVVPQDIGRVILNLITNAFYAVSAKALATADGSAPKSPIGDLKYEPTVKISTKKISLPHAQADPHRIGDLGVNRVEVSVSDNGQGIPPSALDKIFQPFFTTKPSGQGTGLGLSLSYDIIKAHGGEIRVETKEGEGTTMFIQIPNA